MKPIRLTAAAAEKLIFAALTGAGTASQNARYFTQAILDTELSGLDGHGFYWLHYYCAHVKSGKVDGKARPKVKMASPVAVLVDANRGFTHPAIEAGFKKLVPAASKFGVAAMAVSHSYNAATLGFHTGTLAEQGLVAFGFTNAMPILAPVGGKKPVVGTNPMSFAVPGRKGQIAFLMDQSASAVTWTRLKRAADKGESIPLGWALDKNGQPTDDPVKGLAGSLVPSGGAKGFNLAVMVEIMCACMTGSALAPNMGSFTKNDGRSVDCGQFFIAFDMRKFAGATFHKQLETLLRSITSQKGARLANSRRAAKIAKNKKHGLTIDAALYATLKNYCK
jgi:(2R)-3-sulfolactate dehydrogenase (NADP+)